MKAAVCYEFGKPLVVEEVVLDPPQAGEVKVRVAACAICHSDIHYLEGAWGGTLPAVYGHEAAGIVTEVGTGVTSTKPGDHVVVTLIRSCGRCFYCAQGQPHLCETQIALHKESRLHTKDGRSIVQGVATGAFAEYVVVHESQIVAIPTNVPFCQCLIAGLRCDYWAGSSGKYGACALRQQRGRDWGWRCGA